MTSNIGAQYIDKMQKIGFTASKNDAENYNDTKEKVNESLKQHFRPEFLNRIDEIVIFDILSPEAIKNIVSIELEKVKARLADKDIKLEFAQSAVDYLAKEGYNPQYGARPLKRLIQNKILNSVASLIIEQTVTRGGTIKVEFDSKKGDKNSLGIASGDFVLEVKKAKKADKGSAMKESLVATAV